MPVERSDKVTAVTRVYRSDKVMSATLRCSLLGTAGAEMAQQSTPLSASDFDGRLAELRWALPLDQLTAGDYLLEITASGGTTTASRRVRFAIR